MYQHGAALGDVTDYFESAADFEGRCHAIGGAVTWRKAPGTTDTVRTCAVHALSIDPVSGEQHPVVTYPFDAVGALRAADDLDQQTGNGIQMYQAGVDAVTPVFHWAAFVIPLALGAYVLAHVAADRVSARRG